MDVKSLLEESARLNLSGRQVEAEPLARQAVAVADALVSPRGLRERLLPVAQQRLGVSLRLQGRFAEAEPVLREALRGADRGQGYSARITIKTQIQLGLTLIAQGRYADADKELREAMTRCREPRDADTRDAWLESRARLGRLQVLVGNYPEAETLLTSVLENSDGMNEEGARRWRQKSAMTLALMRQRQGDPAAAEAPARLSVELAAEAWGTRHAATGESYDQYGQILFKLGRLEEAEPWLRKSAAISEPLLGQDYGGASKPFRDLGKLLAARGQTAEAEAMFNRATAAVTKSASDEVLVQTLRAHADFLKDQGRPEAAQPLFDRAIVAADRLFALSRGLDPAAREAKLTLLRPLYSEAVSNRVRLDAKAPGRGHDRAALVDVSRTQSRMFTELLRTAAVARLADDDRFHKLKTQRDKALNRLDELNRRFTLVARMDEAGEEALPVRPINDPYVLERWRKEVATLRRDIAEVGRDRESAESKLWRDFPRYMELDDPRPLAVEELQQRWLRPKETLLAYYRLQRELLVFMVSRENFRLFRVPVEMTELDRLIASARQPMESGGRLAALAQLDPDALHHLYELLLKPVEASLPQDGRVLLVGDGPLYTLPFEMLVRHWGERERKDFTATRKPDLSEYGHLDYAGGQWRFSYWPSLAALAIQRGQTAGEGRYSENLIAFADPLFSADGEQPATATRSLLQEHGVLRGGKVSIPQLPETAEEVLAVAEILGGEHSLYLREAAQESQVKRSDLGHARYLHFATHGLLGGEFAMLKGYAAGEEKSGLGTRSLEVVDEGEGTPQLKPAPVRGEPALVMTLVGDLSGEDGLLTMSEVMGLRMNADLVVLSACNTAGERTESRSGEGFAGLTRAFMNAGARGLLVSHWSVESQATRELVTDFFRRLKAGAAPAAALAAAQADLRNSRDARLKVARSHPFFWAPFVHVGD